MRMLERGCAAGEQQEGRGCSQLPAASQLMMTVLCAVQSDLTTAAAAAVQRNKKALLGKCPEIGIRTSFIECGVVVVAAREVTLQHPVTALCCGRCCQGRGPRRAPAAEGRCV